MNKTGILSCILISAVLFWVCASGLSSAADVAYFVKKSTWLETVLASNDALEKKEGEERGKRLARKDADPVLKAFEPQHIQVVGKDEPQHLQIRVKGMKEVFIGSSGYMPVLLGNPKLIDSEGKATPVDFGKCRVNWVKGWGRMTNDKSDGWQPRKCGGQTFEKGALLDRCEIRVALDGKVDVVDVWIDVEDKNGRNPVLFWVNWTSTYNLEEQHAEALEIIQKETMAVFPDSVAYREFRLESKVLRCAWDGGAYFAYREFRLEGKAGVFKDEEETDIGVRADRKGEDWAELAKRYAKECGAQKAKALELAKNCKSLNDLQAIRGMFYLPHAKARLELAAKTLEFVQKSEARPKLAEELKQLQQQLAEVEKGSGSGEELYARTCEFRRRVILSHPLLDFPKLLVNKRSGFLREHMCDQYLGRHSSVAQGLVMLENWRDNPKATALLEGKLPAGGLIQPDLSYDGKKVLFAFADDSPARQEKLKGYHIYEYSLEDGKIRQVTGTDRDPMVGQLGRETVLVEDMDPCYLPDGGVAFISTRSQQYGRCHGGRYVPSYTLYRGEMDGSNIRALSYNEANEWAPSVLSDGSLVYCRWDYVNRHDTRFQSLWAIHPDGTQTAHYYGNNSPSPCMISEPQVIPDTHKVISTACAHHGQSLGTLITVDPRKGQDYGAPLKWITPELPFPESGVPVGIAKADMPLADDIQGEGRAGMPWYPGGRAGTPWPLSEDIYLCTYKHGSQYAVYLVDTLGGREMIYSDPHISCFDPIPLRPRPMPPVMPSLIAGREDRKTGVFFVQDVYQSTEQIPRNSVKSMRINQIISQPTSSAPPRSFVINELVKKVLGTVPVNHDGSVAFEAPANTPIQMQLLDENGMAVMTMRSLVYLQPGERASCVGCHEPRKNAPLPVRPALATIHKISPPVGPRYDCGMSFVRTVQPVLDRYCISCHGLEKTEKNLELTGVRMDKGGEKWMLNSAAKSYWHLLDVPNMVKVAPRNGETYPSHTNDYFASAGELAKMLLDGHPDKDGKKLVHVDRESFQRIVDWLDLNAQYYGDYSFNRIEDRTSQPEGEKVLREAVRKRFGDQMAGQPYATLVNVANPDESRILMAALPVAAGGWGQITQGAFQGKNDSAYQEMKKLVDGSITPLQYHDIAGTCGRDNPCACGCCWVRADNAGRKQGTELADQLHITRQIDHPFRK